MRIVAALGGNALLERGERPDAVIQLRHVRQAAVSLAAVASRHELVICHGNGPQVGLLALESATDPSLNSPYPLDVLGAQTQGMIGYWLAQCLGNAGLTKPVVGLLTQVVVDPADPAFAVPTKFVGATYSRDEALLLADRHGWSIARDGARWRRVVPSPAPQEIIELAPIRQLLATGAVVICAGGGGIPVTRDRDGLCGVEAVIDKDRTAALLAIALQAERFLVLTDVTAVMQDFGTPQAVERRQIGLDELMGTEFPAGSMGPKIQACGDFVAATGRPAAIGALSDATAILAGTAGTTIRPAATRARQGGRRPRV